MNFLKRNSLRRKSRSGQTLVDYALIYAFVVLIGIDEMGRVGEMVSEQIAYGAGSLLIAQTYATVPPGTPEGLAEATEMSAVDNFLAQPNTWGNASPTYVAGAVKRLHSRFYFVIYGVPDPNP